MNFKLLLLALPCLASAAPVSLDVSRTLDVQAIHETAHAKFMDNMERDLGLSEDCLNDSSILIQDQTLNTIYAEIWASVQTEEQALQVCSFSGYNANCSFASNPKQAEYSTQCTALSGTVVMYTMIATGTVQGQSSKFTYSDVPFCAPTSCHDPKEVVELYGDVLEAFLGAGELADYSIEIIVGGSTSGSFNSNAKGLTAALGLVLAGFTLWN